MSSTLSDRFGFPFERMPVSEIYLLRLVGFARLNVLQQVDGARSKPTQFMLRKEQRRRKRVKSEITPDQFH